LDRDLLFAYLTSNWVERDTARNALAHGNFTVDLGIVWQTVRNDLPALRAQVEALSL